VTCTSAFSRICASISIRSTDCIQMEHGTGSRGHTERCSETPISNIVVSGNRRVSWPFSSLFRQQVNTHAKNNPPSSQCRGKTKQITWKER
jgi:hypothetical protein